jgi:osmoprotectant transport system ATP-binding protein
MGYAIQSVGLFPRWTVARNIAAVPQLLGWPADRV